MICYACSRSLTNDPTLSNFGKWTVAPIDGERQAYCAFDGWCETYTLKAEVGEFHPGMTGRERQRIRGEVDPWFA